MRITGYQTNDLNFVSTGLCPNCEICKDNWGYDSMEKFNQDISSGDLQDSGNFSWNPCDDCNTRLGGDSFVAHGINSSKELIHFKICYDCLMEFNGYTVGEF